MNSQSVSEIAGNGRHWPGRVLVGVDSSTNGARAVEWAIREVAARGSSLRIGSTSERPMCFDRHGEGDLQQRRLARLFREVRDEHPSLAVEMAAGHGSPRHALLGEAGHADLLVLAASDEQSVEAVLLGSLARKAVRRSPCPVVIVRGSINAAIRRIVIGVDGSSAAAAALDWACDEANLHGATLHVIHAREGDISRAEAGCVLDLAVNECRHRTGVTVRGVLVEGSPVSAMVEASRTADIVAVGSRGRSGFKTALFGSVALSVAERAHCPVAVTHPTPSSAAG